MPTEFFLAEAISSYKDSVVQMGLKSLMIWTSWWPVDFPSYLPYASVLD